MSFRKTGLIALLVLLVPAAMTAGETPKAPARKDGAVTDKQVKEMVEELRSRYYWKRFRASLQLVEAGRPAMEELRKGLYDNDTFFRINCIDVLLLLGDKSILPDLIKIAHGEKHAMLRETALRAVKVLDPFLKRTAALAGGDIGEAAKAVKETLKSCRISTTLTFDIEQYLVPEQEFHNSASVLEIDDHARVRAIFEEITSLVKEGKHGEALEKCQSILEMRLSSAVTLPDDPMRFTGFTPAALPLLGEMDAALLKMYREMYDPDAEAALERMGTGAAVADLYDFFKVYFYTSYGREAFERIIEAFFERGDYREVIWAWDRYGSLLPGVSLPSLARVCLSACRVADRDRAVEMYALVKLRYPDGVILVGSTEKNAAKYLYEQVVNAPRHPPVTRRRGDSTIYGSPFVVEAKSDDFDFTGPAWVRSTRVFHRNLHARACRDLTTGKTVWVLWKDVPRDYKEREEFFRKRNLDQGSSVGGSFRENGAPPYGDHPYNPVVFDDMVLINNGKDVTCFSAKDGSVIWRHVTNIDDLGMLNAQQSGRRLAIWRPVKFPYTTVVPQENAVYVTMESDCVVERALREFREGKGAKSYNTGSELKCLDLKTGRVRWSTSSSDDTFPSSLYFYSAPKYKSGVLYYCTAVCKDRVFQGLSWIYTIALDAKTGQLLWKTPLAEITGRLALNLAEGTPITAATPEVQEDTVIALTNSGVIASMRACDGGINWVAKYEQNLPKNPRRDLLSGEVIYGITDNRANNPPVVWGGMVFAMPNDSDYLFAFDATTGKLLWKVSAVRRETRRYDKEPERCNQFLIDSDGTSYLIGVGVLAIDIDGNVKWEHPTAGSVKYRTLSGTTIYKTGGRGALLEDCVAVPEPDRLLLLDKRTGKISKIVELNTNRTLLDRIHFLSRELLAAEGEKAEALMKELTAFGLDAVSAVRQAAEKAEGDEKIALKYIADKIAVETYGLPSERSLLTGRKVTGNILVTPGIFLLTTSQGEIIAFRRR
jgi:outer membrane protein assembly factor BamB